LSSPDLVITRRSAFARVDPEHLSQLAAIPSSMLGDGMGRRRGLGPSVQALAGGKTFVGSALTIRCRGGDNLAALVALSSILPGDVVVIATGGNVEAAVVGGNYASMAKARGAVAIVTDGLVRDLDELDEIGIPVYGAGVTPNGPFKTGPGEIGVPVTIGDLPILPGDALVGDRDGVVALPAGRVQEAIEKGRAVQAREASMAASNAKGEIPAWLGQLIEAVPVRDLD
jgi:regulator of RNase E activity RraA